jgi:hypothetical protein
MRHAAAVELLEVLKEVDASDDPSDPLEAFVAARLSKGGVWSSPRESDRVAWHRIVERGPARLRVCGRIWTIDQTEHSFWLDVAWEAEGRGGATWTLFFEVDETSGSRRARLAVYAIGDPGDVECRSR